MRNELGLSSTTTLAALLVSTALHGAHLVAQCANDWQPGNSRPGANHNVQCSRLWDPDGPGPATPILLAGGRFVAFGDAAARGVAGYDPSTGASSSMGAGLTRPTNPIAVMADVLSVAGYPNGDLLAVGFFEFAGTTPTNNIARWDGQNWYSMDATGGFAFHAFVSRSGTAYIAGRYQSGGVWFEGIATWNGTAWNWFATTDQAVKQLDELPNGDLVASGQFTNINGVPVNGLARWNGVAWSNFGQSPLVGCHASRVMANGDLLVAGPVPAVGTQVARFDGVAWTLLPGNFFRLSGWPNPVLVAAPMAVVTDLPNGDIVAAGDFIQVDNTPARGIARWDGAAWSSLNSDNIEIMTLTPLPNGELFAGGIFTQIGGVHAQNAALWNGTAWRAIAPGLAGRALALQPMSNGDLVVGGSFSQIANIPANSIARWDGNGWSDLGGGFQQHAWLGRAIINALAELPNGDLVAAGWFTAAGGSPIASIARWDASAWQAIGNNLGGTADCLALAPTGDIYVGGALLVSGNQAQIARWDGVNWTPLGGVLTSNLGGSYVRTLAVLPNGNLVAAGAFNQIGGIAANNIARWDGNTWYPMGTGSQKPGTAMLQLPTGNLLVAWSDYGGVGPNLSRWNGASWSQVLQNQSYGLITGMVTTPNGDLVVVGSFPSLNGVPTAGIARWNGATWSPLGLGINPAIRGNGHGSAMAVAFRQNGELVVGGDFVLAGSHAAAGLAQFRTSCPAVAIGLGVGCIGSAGRNRLTATSWPYVGGRLQTATDGLAHRAIVASVWGFLPRQPATPLALLTPNALPGCDVLVDADFVTLQDALGGIASTQHAIPNLGALVGFTFHQQSLALELDAQGVVTAATASNALALTIGVF